MQFLERRIENGYSYDVEDVFGKIHLESRTQLDGGLLDDVVLTLMRQNLRAAIIEGEVKCEDNTLVYHFERAPQWSEDEEEAKTDLCDTSTSTSAPESADTLIIRLRTSISNWLRRFADRLQRR